MELYIYNKKIYKNALHTQPLNQFETRVSYGDDFSATLHFPAGTLSAGDEILVAIDSDMFFGQNGTSPMAMQVKTITADDATSQTATFTLSTNTERFYTVVNGKQTPVLAYLGIYQHKATSTEDFPQIELALGAIGAMPVVGLFSDETTPVYPEKYYTKEETDALFVPNAEKGIANGVATLDDAGKIPREQIPEGGTIVIDNALSTTSTNPVQNRVIAGAMQKKANLVNGKVPASELPEMNYIPTGEKGTANGVATLDSTGKVPSTQLPTMDYVPNAEKGVANGVATLDNQGKVPNAQLPTMDYIPNAEKGTANGVATLDSTGKVPASEIPSLDYIPTSEKGVANGVATLDSTGKVPSTELPAMDYIPTSEKDVANGVAVLNADQKLAVTRIPYGVDYGLTSMYNLLAIYKATNGNIDARNQHCRPIVPSSLNYAVTSALTDSNHITLNSTQQHTAQAVFFQNGITQPINTIPDATSTHTLAEGVYKHTPDTAPTYTLPNVSYATRTHEIIIYVDFSNATSVAFEDANGTTISPLKPISISTGDKYCFLCQYVFSQWQIMPIEMGGNA